MGRKNVHDAVNDLASCNIPRAVSVKQEPQGRSRGLKTAALRVQGFSALYQCLQAHKGSLGIH